MDHSSEVPPSETPTRSPDPRFADRWFEVVPERGDRGTAVLVGAVHDHPASVHRVAETVAALSPDVLALEVAPGAVPLFERTADQIDDRHAFGETTAAVRACNGGRVVGIDAPTPEWFGAWARHLRRERPSAGTAWGALKGMASTARHAVRYRVAAAAGALPGVRPRPDPPVAFDATPADPPGVQARDERRQADRSRSLLSAVELPSAVATLDELRERAMAARLRALRTSGDVVAVVGLSHLDPVARRLGPDRE